MESPQFVSAVMTAFPDSVAALLYKSFPPATQGVPVMTLRDYVTGPDGGFSGSGFTSFADYLCPGSLDPGGFNPAAASDLSNRFAQLFGVEQADIDEMNSGRLFGGLAFRLTPGRCIPPRRYVSGARDQREQVARGRKPVQWQRSLATSGFQPGIQRPAVRRVQLVRGNGSIHAGILAFVASELLTKATSSNFQFSYIHTFGPRRAQ